MQCYDALEEFVAQFGRPMNMGTISTVAALGYADGRHSGDGWRDGRPKLSSWYAGMIKRQAVAATMPNF